MSDYPEIDARFARDTAAHRMTVLHEEGLYRHLRFEAPERGSVGPFELITWPHNLVAKAGWTFHFDIDATLDMFDLFRRTALTGEINPGYWAEKVRAGRDEIEGYDPNLLKGQIASTIAQWMRDDLADRVWGHAKARGLDPEELDSRPNLRKWLSRQVRPEWMSANRELREAVHEHFFSDMSCYNIEFESEAHQSLADFSYRPEGYDGPYPYHFADWVEWRLKDYTPGFLHSCRAIRRGIDLWDAACKQAEVAA
ncbi:hypothetical protein KVH30_01910 [Streptomyces olivaceus]|uniref:hypothetical protein n=1 Tax=Streptomyces olivaceus TaxID=47716 RepID=UPI001CC9114F|nr:hypothetical protein [Streptomyces olivaceus]MBZ6290326.1 hypothetical protein [Streptomyces olivaceus]MBZ6324278.1 hypothetical protein [Streptomyces olivaceus]